MVREPRRKQTIEFGGNLVLEMIGRRLEGLPASLDLQDPRPEHHLVLRPVKSWHLPIEGLAQLVEPCRSGVKVVSASPPKVKRVSETF
jgi:hypothetical protein